MRTLRTILAVLAAVFLFAGPVLAQTDLNLAVRRDWGYSNGSQIRGTVSMSATSSSDLKSVDFFIDGKPVGQDSTAPFSHQFNTSDYAVGLHELTATAETAGGQTLTSNVRRFEFISQQQEQSGMAGIIGPLMGIVAVIFVVMMGFQFLTFRRRKGEPVPLGARRNYSFRGGAICPRCGRPTPLHMAAINLGIGTRLDLCDNCGRYGALKVRSIDELRRAEAAEVLDARPAEPIHEQSEEEKLREQLNSSRYDAMK